MKAAIKYILFFSAPVMAAIVCLWRSKSVISGFQDCRSFYNLIDTVPMPPAPPNCADAQMLFSYDIYTNSALGLFLLPVGIALFFYLKKVYESGTPAEEIKIINSPSASH